MEQVRWCNNLEILERFHKDSLKANTYIEYHKDNWLKALSFVVEEQNRSSNNQELWIKAYRGFANFYKTAIRSGLNSQTEKLEYDTEMFSEINALTLGSNDQEYMNECERMIPLLGIDFENFNPQASYTFKRWVTWGWFPYITFQNIHNTPRGRLLRTGILRFLLAAMNSILDIETQKEIQEESTWQSIQELMVWADKMGFPVWMWEDLLECISKNKKIFLVQILKQQSNKEIYKPFITASLSLSSDAKNWERDYSHNLIKDLEEKNFHAVDQSLEYINSLHRWENGFTQQLFGLAYHLDYYLATQFLTPEIEPFTIYLVCNHPYYSTDLKFLMLLAEKSNHWGRFIIIKKIKDLLLGERRLSYRLLLYFYLNKSMSLIIKTREKKILNWILEDLIPWQRLHILQTKWFGRCLGHALVREATPEQVRIFFDNWNPKPANYNLEAGFIELTRYLEITPSLAEISKVWNRGILQIWLKRIILGYKKGEAFGYDSETKLENLAIIALKARYSTNNQWLNHLKYLLKIWKRHDLYWNSDYQIQINRRDSILAALVVVLYAGTHLTGQNRVYSPELKILLKDVHLIIYDKRLWQVDRIKKRYVKSRMLNNIENATNSLIEKLTV